MPESTLRPGQSVLPAAGPFVDHVGTLLYLAAKDRVRLLLSIRDLDVSTTVSRQMVAPVT